MCIRVLLTSMSVYCLHVWHPQCARPAEGAGSPGTGVTDKPKMLHGFWKLKLGFLEEHQVPLTTEPSLWLSLVFFFLLKAFLYLSLTLLIRKQKQSQALWYMPVSAATSEAEKGGFRTKAGPEPLNESKISGGGSVRPF